MKLTGENIRQIDRRLRKSNVDDIDVRAELLDHFAEELSGMDGDFDRVFERFYRSKRKMMREFFMRRARQNLGSGFRHLFSKLFTVRYLMFYATVAVPVFVLTLFFEKQLLMRCIGFLPIIIAGPITFIMSYQRFFVKQFSAYSNSILAAVNFIVVTYIFLGYYWIKDLNDFRWILVYSFYLSLSCYYYYLFFEARKESKFYSKLFKA